MAEKSGSDSASQMKEAREHLKGGDVRDALVLALEVLWRELDQLRGTLGAIHQNLPPLPPSPSEATAEMSRFEFVWQDPPSYLLH